MWTRGKEKHTSGCRDKWTAWGVSIALHGLLFLVLAFFGVFSLLKPAYDNSQALEVVLYDAEAAPEAGGNAQAAASEGSVAADVPTIDWPREAVLPEIHEDFTKLPEKQEEYRKQHQQNNVDSSVSKSGSSAGNGSKEGNAADNVGNGGNEKGNRNGAGQGTGSDFGGSTGNGTGTGRDAALAQRPKTPPQLLQGQNPRYPQDLEEEGIGGSVLVSLLVGSDGCVQSVSVAASSGYAEFDAAAVEAGYGYRFAPARNVYDEPVACRISRRIVFQP